MSVTLVIILILGQNMQIITKQTAHHVHVLSCSRSSLKGFPFHSILRQTAVMAAMALPPSDRLVPSSVGISTRRYEVVEDVVIEVSTQLNFPNSAYSSPQLSRGSGVGAKKKLGDGGLNRSKSCGEGRGKAPPHGLVDNRVVVREKGHNKQKEKRTWRCGGQCRLRFRCGALCLLLPGLPVFGFRLWKGKRDRKAEAEAVAEGDEEEGGCISISISTSRRVSLEKFECGSWASSGMVVHEDGELGTGTGSLYFDLPMELIRNSSAQTQSPVKAAFVFDRDRKGVHHHVPVWSKPKSAEESGAAASPCIITPRLRKAREEFNALLEAHTHIL